MGRNCAALPTVLPSLLASTFTLLLLLLSCPDTEDQELFRNPQAFSARIGLLKLAACELRWYWVFGLSSVQMAIIGLPGSYRVSRLINLFSSHSFCQFFEPQYTYHLQVPRFHFQHVIN